MHEAHAILLAAAQAGVFPGAVLAVGDADRLVDERAVGLLARVPQPGSPTTTETIWDVASLTKVVVTASLVMRLVEAGRLAIDAKVRAFLPELTTDAGAITIRDLLCHASGLPAWRHYYERLWAGDLAGATTPRAAILRMCAAEPPEAPAGVRTTYSDVGFILLGFVIERAGGGRLDDLARSAIFEPLGMTRTRYVDLDGPRPRWEANVAPTEVCARRGLVVGEVHDENCHAAGGILGHAGLFSTARDLSRFAAALCASARGERVPGGFHPDVVRTFFAPSGVPGSTYRLGWDGPSPDPGHSSAGDLWPKDGVGHLGFTGCSLWLDPARGRWVVLLSNRVHPTRQDQRIRQLRPVLHDAIVRALDARYRGRP